jgi:tetratricopeptide (TPR) repeat protein
MNKNVIIYLLVIISGFGISCKSSKNVADDDKADRTKNFQFNSVFLEAYKQKQLGEYEKALEYYSRALRIEPENATVMYEIAGVVAVLGDIPSGINYAKMAVDSDPDNLYFNIMLSRLYQRNGMIKEAAEAYNNVVEMQDTKMELYFEQSSLYVAVGDYKNAIKVLDKAEKRFGVNEIISLEKERIFRSTDNTDKARKELQKLSEAFPDQSRFSAMLAEAYLEDGDIDKAGKAYEKMLQNEIDDGYVHISIADYYRMIDDYEKTFKHLELAFAAYYVELDVKVQMLANILPVIGSDKYLNDKVYRLLDIMLENYPYEPKVLTIYSDYLVKDGRWQEAQEAFDKVLSMEKSKYLLWEQALYIDGQLNDFEHMLKLSNEAIELFPFQTMLYLFNTVAAIQQKEYNKVIESSKKGVELSGGNKNLLVELYTYQAEAYYQIEMYPESDSAFEKLLEIEPDNVFAINNYAYYLALRNENIERALNLGEQLIKLAPNNPSYLDTYAWVLYRAEKYEQALEIIEKSVKNGGGTNPTILEHYGDILYMNNEPEKAKAQWEKAMSVGSDSETLQQKIETGVINK